ncbi:MAG: hypothetical protein A3J28_04005 [Acidobacteria bacterium RIFCSPLOWO2_12_FULL_60_22]|nr:MAG: hypothetical protein A3J28_04005 [Acidobacteria bacterium RIFCSPLOWO2_12_FULL_60_22]
MYPESRSARKCPFRPSFGRKSFSTDGRWLRLRTEASQNGEGRVPALEGELGSVLKSPTGIRTVAPKPGSWLGDAL